jgi:N-acetylmuramoyl-L-alanine amidase
VLNLCECAVLKQFPILNSTKLIIKLFVEMYKPLWFIKKVKKIQNLSVLILIFAGLIPITSFSPALFPYGIKKVVIDAGHGGHDPGCVGLISKEKDVALSVSLKLGKLIEENLKDVQVIYTRNTDKFIELRERANIANRNKADLFISIHCNASPNKAPYGAETYVMGLHKTKDNLDVAKRENSAILMEKDYEKEYDGFDPKSDEANIMFSLYQSAFLEQSLNIASKIQDHFKSKPARLDRGVKQAGFLVLYMTAMPSILVELGFLSNKVEEEFLASENGQDLMAIALFQAFKEYKFEAEGKKIPPIANDNNVAKPVLVKNPPEEKKVPEPVKEKEALVIKPFSSDSLAQIGIVFKVQFATSSTPIEAKPENFNGLTNISSFEAGGLYRYAFGEERTFEGAKKLQEEVRNQGFKDAFIISFKNGERIPVSEALKEVSK